MRPLTAVLAVFAALVPAGVVMAASGGPAELAASIAGQENTNTEANLDYLFAIYIITWAGFFAYIFVVSRRQRTLEREIDGLKALLDEHNGAEKG
jgi:CcmD family protein